MADSVITVTVIDQRVSGDLYVVMGTLAIGAGPGTYTANGIACSLSNEEVKAQRAPLRVDIFGMGKVNAQTQYDYTYLPGSDVTAGKLKIFSGGAEITGSPTAMPAGVSGDTINFTAYFRGMM